MITRKLFVQGLVAGAALALGNSAGIAAAGGTPEEAKAMLARAVALAKTKGKDEAAKVFNEGADGFKDRDLYVVMINDSGVFEAHGDIKAMVGRNMMDLRDPDGQPIVRSILGVKDNGMVEFKWKNPLTNAVAPKQMFCSRMGDVVLAVGAYK